MSLFSVFPTFRANLETWIILKNLLPKVKKKVIAHGRFIWAVVYRFLVNILVSSLTLHLNPQCPYSLTVEEILKKCPVFGNGVCPYKALADEMKGIAGNCPGFKHGCPFKNLKTMGEYVGKLAEMRDKTATPKGRAAFEKLMKRVHEISKEAEKKAGPWPFPPDTCPIFARDAHGKHIMPKYN